MISSSVFKSLIMPSKSEDRSTGRSPLSSSGFGGSALASPSALLHVTMFGSVEHCGRGSVEESV